MNSYPQILMLSSRRSRWQNTHHITTCIVSELLIVFVHRMEHIFSVRQYALIIMASNLFEYETFLSKKDIHRDSLDCKKKTYSGRMWSNALWPTTLVHILARMEQRKLNLPSVSNTLDTIICKQWRPKRSSTMSRTI